MCWHSLTASCCFCANSYLDFASFMHSFYFSSDAEIFFNTCDSWLCTMNCAASVLQHANSWFSVSVSFPSSFVSSADACPNAPAPSLPSGCFSSHLRIISSMPSVLRSSVSKLHLGFLSLGRSSFLIFSHPTSSACFSASSSTSSNNEHTLLFLLCAGVAVVLSSSFLLMMVLDKIFYPKSCPSICFTILAPFYCSSSFALPSSASFSGSHGVTCRFNLWVLCSS